MTDFLGAGPGERTESRIGYRAGYYGRSLVTRIGKLELRIPRDRGGEFSTALFERYARSEKALVAALAEMYVQGVSTRKVKAITEELCGHSFSASAISAINKGLDEALAKFAHRPLDEPYPYLILDARYERIRDNGVIAHQAVLIAIGINWEGKRQVLAVEMANRESQSSWKDVSVNPPTFFSPTCNCRTMHSFSTTRSDGHGSGNESRRHTTTAQCRGMAADF